MKKLVAIIFLAALFGTGKPAVCERLDSWPNTTIDQSLLGNDGIAYFEGDSLSYIISPPDGFKMVLDEAQADGYAMAFIPVTSGYDSAQIVITADIFSYAGKQAGPVFREFVTSDTIAMRKHYGPSLALSRVDSIYTSNGTELQVYFMEDKSRFISNVMLAYLFGGSELFAFELSIRENFPRFEAEEKFIECLEQIKVLVKGELGEK